MKVVWLHSFLTLTLDGVQWLVLRPGVQYPLYWRLGRSQTRYSRFVPSADLLTPNRPAPRIVIAFNLYRGEKHFKNMWK